MPPKVAAVEYDDPTASPFAVTSPLTTTGDVYVRPLMLVERNTPHEWLVVRFLVIVSVFSDSMYGPTASSRVLKNALLTAEVALDGGSPPVSGCRSASTLPGIGCFLGSLMPISLSRKARRTPQAASRNFEMRRRS